MQVHAEDYLATALLHIKQELIPRLGNTLLQSFFLLNVFFALPTSGPFARPIKRWVEFPPNSPYLFVGFLMLVVMFIL